VRHPSGPPGARAPSTAVRARGAAVSDFATLEDVVGAYGDEEKPRIGFFTDTSICIGCKACEVACKEWNVIPEDGLVWTGESYDNTSTLGANSWRHVAFVEQRKPLRTDGEVATIDPGEVANTAPVDAEPLRWLMSS